MSAVPPAVSSPRSSLLPWFMWGLGALFYTYGFFQRVAPSVMVGELMRDFAVGAAITGTLSSLYFYTYAGLQIPIGLMLDKYGPRRVLVLACLFSAAGSAFFASAQGLLPAYVGRAMIGAGAAVTWVGALKLATLWFPPRRFALLTGLTMAFGMAGAVGGQAPLSAAVDAFGWRGTLYFAAGLALVLGAFIWIVVRDHGSQPNVHAARSKDDTTPKPRLLDGLKIVLRTPQTWWTSLFGAMMSAPMLAFAALWGVPYMMDVHDLSKESAALGTSLMLVGWGIGSPLVG
ncbi:MAG: MFS transporter, partial [Rhodospirillaceae bacterium]